MIKVHTSLPPATRSSSRPRDLNQFAVSLIAWVIARRLEPLEHGQVVLVQAFAHGEMVRLVTARVQAVAVADGHLDARMPGIVRGGTVRANDRATEFRQRCVRRKTTRQLKTFSRPLTLRIVSHALLGHAAVHRSRASLLRPACFGAGCNSSHSGFRRTR